MKLTKGEYCQFTMKGRLQLLKEFGEFLNEKMLGNKSMQLYKLYDFYVEVIFNKGNEKYEYAEPVKAIGIVGFYN
ncbi:MAG: hypothetical protein NVS9B7_29770 [Flavisolibacter sp.]